MADKVYPEGVTSQDHAQHDLKMGRSPNQSSVETFLKEREVLAAQEKVAHLPGREDLALVPVPAAVSECLGFFASVIKSGEPWTETCEEMYAKAKAAMAGSAAAP
ncbi:hypothetical protein ACFQE0_13660 [Methylobacterium komagatae]|uniref:Uncharacterized protein n=1 Tax=Methylobacterium komagatae TaxID=374425 RepID=A0ABW2BKA9_9HYPH